MPCRTQQTAESASQRREAQIAEAYRYAICPPFWHRPTRARVMTELRSLGVILFWVSVATVPPAAVLFYFITGGSR